MKVVPFKIQRNFGELMMIQRDQLKHIYDTLHQHPELQITYIRESSGTAVIGGHIGEFHAGDIFVIGSNIPHVFRNEDVYYYEETDVKAEVIYLFLDDKLPGNELLDFRELHDFFYAARQGIKFRGRLREKIGVKMEALLNKGPMERMIMVLDILREIIQSDDIVFLNNEIIRQRIDENDGKRLNDVIQYTFKNYPNKITLEEVAEVANMVPSAFCRFFKQRTRKTYFDFLNEIRVRHACKLLLTKDRTIVDICYQSGFNNLSYFNRKFKDITGYSPLNYHKALKGNQSFKDIISINN